MRGSARDRAGNAPGGARAWQSGETIHGGCGENDRGAGGPGGELGPALAQDGPQPWQISYQQPATLVMEYIDWFSWYTVIIMSLVVLLVIGLIAWCVWKFNERTNTVPSRITHNTTIEVLWTVLPVLILVAIAIPSFRLLYGQYDPSKLYADFDPQTTKFLNVKVTGVQWSWNVDYSNDEDSSRTASRSRSRSPCS